MHGQKILKFFRVSTSSLRMAIIIRWNRSQSY